MEQLLNIFLVFLVTYIIPTAICAVFATKHNHDNPFKKGSKSWEWCFAPVANVVCVVAIIYYVCVELVLKPVFKWIIKRFKKWNED